jgi:hypothetical protein
MGEEGGRGKVPSELRVTPPLLSVSCLVALSPAWYSPGHHHRGHWSMGRSLGARAGGNPRTTGLSEPAGEPCRLRAPAPGRGGCGPGCVAKGPLLSHWQARSGSPCARPAWQGLPAGGPGLARAVQPGINLKAKSRFGRACGADYDGHGLWETASGVQ